MSRPARLTAVLLALAAPLAFAGPASAEEPLALTEQITDTADVLDSGEESDVQAALEQLQAEDGTQLYVVYVDSFDGASGGEWAQQTFQQSGLGTNEIVFAVATGTSATATTWAATAP